MAPALLVLTAGLMAGCSEQAPAGGDGGAPPPPGPGGPAGGPGKMGGPGGPGGGPPTAANATPAEVFTQRCQGCHGAGGKGGKAPDLTQMGSKDDAELKQVIQNGKGRMPPKGEGLSEEQLSALAGYVKKLGG
jgi:cytochrome c553